MSLFSGPEEHAANPPDTWEVRKLGDRLWEVTTTAGVTFAHFRTRRDAEAAVADSWFRVLYDDEGRWYAGEQVRNWRPWATVAATKGTVR